MQVSTRLELEFAFLLFKIIFAFLLYEACSKSYQNEKCNHTEFLTCPKLKKITKAGKLKRT